MKIKTINKILLIIFTTILIFLSIFALVAHLKGYPNVKPEEQMEIDIEEPEVVRQTIDDEPLNIGQVIFNAIFSAKQASNIYYTKDDNNKFSYADAEKYYSQYEYYYIPTQQTITAKQWLVLDSESYTIYSLEYNEKCVITDMFNQTFDFCVYSSYLDYILQDCDYLLDLAESYEKAELTASLTELSENEIVIEFIYDENETITVEIVDGYIVKITTVGFDYFTETVKTTIETYAYNVEDVEVPKLPNVQWIEW